MKQDTSPNEKNTQVEQPNSAKLGARARRINSLIASSNSTRYLEIGVQRGITFFNVNCKYKTAVDPHFMFDKTANSSEYVKFYECSSDRFFEKLHISEKFDIIYLDGLHTFEQTYRDFCNSIVHSHDQTIIIIDDTKPNDVYSSLPNQSWCNRFRQRASITETNAWHGDVYKTIFMIHDFHLQYDYRTVVGSGNPQTIVWKSKAAHRVPLFGSMEKISRLSYFDMINNIKGLIQADEDSAIELCLTQIKNNI